MVSRENTVILACGAVALTGAYLGYAVTDADDTVWIAFLLFVGVVLPTTVNEALDRRA
jgi:hypothetical protein